MKLYILIFIIFFAVSYAGAQPKFANNPSGFNQQPSKSVQPFLFSVNTLTPANSNWNFNYSGSLAKRTSSAFGFDGIDQNIAVKGYLGKKITLLASVAIGFSTYGGTKSAQRAEVIKDFVGGKKLTGPHLGLGVGLSRDWDNVKSALSRITLNYNAVSWMLLGNMLFEKPFSSIRDKVDFTTSIGFHHRINSTVYAGFEMIGQDLEGFWEKDEAEGGAKMLIGPSFTIAPIRSKFTFSASGGPVFTATKSTAIPVNAIRDLGNTSVNNGYSIRAAVGFKLQ